MQEFSVKIEDYIRAKQASKALEFDPAGWLDSASKRAAQISVATHVLKFTNNDAKGTNVYATFGEKDNSAVYVSTSVLSNVKNDFVGNAASSDVAGFLQLEVDGITLLEMMIKNDASPLAGFAKSETQLSSWIDGFKAVLKERELSSHTLAKQIYFPMGNDNYHLLAPLYASSLAQVLYDRVTEDRFGEKAKIARESKKKEQYCDECIVSYPQLAIQMFGGTKPQNTSRLNISRNGKSFLLRSVPPVWKSMKKPPMGKHAFWRMYEQEVYLDVREFQQFLIRVKDRDSNKDIRDQRQEYVEHLIDLLIKVAAEVQSIEQGWSHTSEIPLHEQIWLDRARGDLDQDFKEMRERERWKESIAKRFATWLIQKLAYKNNLEFSDAEHIEFSKDCLEALKAVEL